MKRIERFGGGFSFAKAPRDLQDGRVTRGVVDRAIVNLIALSVGMRPR